MFPRALSYGLWYGPTLYRDITLQQTMLDGTYAHPRAFPTRAHISRTGNGAIEEPKNGGARDSAVGLISDSSIRGLSERYMSLMPTHTGHGGRELSG